MLHKKIIALLAALLTLGILSAAPLVNTPVQVVQPDGRILDILASGDEFHNWLHDSGNFTIVQNDAGYYVYASQEGEKLIPSEWIVGLDLPLQKGLQPGLNLSKKLIAEKYSRYADMRDYSNSRSPHTGTFNNLVVFIKFADDPDFTTPLGVYDEIFNNPEGNSMKRYFYEASYNQLSVNSTFYPAPNGSIIISYTDINPRSFFKIYSVSNPNGYTSDNQRTQREQQLLQRAVAAIASAVPSDLVIDGDGDGYVDNTCFIIKGSPEGWADCSGRIAGCFMRLMPGFTENGSGTSISRSKAPPWAPARECFPTKCSTAWALRTFTAMKIPESTPSAPGTSCAPTRIRPST